MYYNKEINEIKKNLNIDDRGLTQNEVLNRQEKYGKIYYLKRKEIVY